MKCKWGKEQQTAFEKIKSKVAESIMAYSNINKPFIIYTYMSDYEMGNIITQDRNAVSCFLKKFNEAQMNYPTTEQEHLAIMETLKYHHNIILVERSS